VNQTTHYISKKIYTGKENALTDKNSTSSQIDVNMTSFLKFIYLFASGNMAHKKHEHDINCGLHCTSISQSINQSIHTTYHAPLSLPASAHSTLELFSVKQTLVPKRQTNNFSGENKLNIMQGFLKFTENCYTLCCEKVKQNNVVVPGDRGESTSLSAKPRGGPSTWPYC